MTLNNVSNVAASGGTGSLSATLATGQGVGASTQSNLTLTYADAAVYVGALGNLGTTLLTITGNVLGHSDPALSIASGNSQTIITGSTVAAVTLNLSNGTLYQSGLAALDVNSLEFGVSGSTGGALVTSGTARPYMAALSTDTLGVQTQAFSLNVSDDHTLPGASATWTVLDHAAAAFSNCSGTLNLDFGTLQVGSGTQSLQFQIQNLSAAYRAALDLDYVTELSDLGGVFSTDAASFANLAPGATSGLDDLFLDTSQSGQFSGQYQFNLSDEKDLSGHAGAQTLTLNVTANVVPEPSTPALLGGAIVLLGYASRRKGPRRSAKPAAFEPQEVPRILSCRSHSSAAHTARRAA